MPSSKVPAARVLAGSLLGGLALLLVGCLPRAGVGLPSSTLVPEPLGITVEGEGRVEARPDRADLRFTVEAQGPSADEAVQNADAARETILQKLEALGIERGKVLTLQTNVWESGPPLATYPTPAALPPPTPTPAGWRGILTVVLAVGKAAKVEEVLQEITALGAPAVQNITYLEERVEYQFMLEVQAGTADMAQAEAARKAELIHKGLAVKGFPVHEMKIARASLSPLPPGGPSRPPLMYHRARLLLTLALDSLDRLGEVSQVAASSGRIEDLTFGFSQSGELVSQARDKALADARAKAEEIAAKVGVRVAGVINIVEVYLQRPQMVGTPFPPQVPTRLTGITHLTGQAADVMVRLRVTYSFR